MTARVQFFGEYLLAKGLITREALDDALGYQRSVNLPIGFLAQSKGLLTELQVLRVHSEQRKTDRKFGEIAVEKGFISQADLDALLEGQAEVRVYLGEALVGQGHITQEQVDEALAGFHAEQNLATGQVEELLLADPEQEVVNHAVEITIRMFLRMARLVAKVRDASRDAQPLPDSYHSLHQAVKGDKAFTCVLSLDSALLLEVATALLASVMEEPPQEVDEVVLDAGKEFLNIIVGHTCTLLGKGGVKVMPRPPQEGDATEEGTRARVAIAVGDAEAYLDIIS